MLHLLLTVNAAALRPSLNKQNQPPLVHLVHLWEKKPDYKARAAERTISGRSRAVEMASSLLEAGRADPDARDAKRGSALQYAAEFGCLEIVEVLLFTPPYTPLHPLTSPYIPLPPVHPLTPSTPPYTPLHPRTTLRFVSQVLLEKRADPNAMDKASNTPLHLALVWSKHRETAAIVAALLEVGTLTLTPTPTLTLTLTLTLSLTLTLTLSLTLTLTLSLTLTLTLTLTPTLTLGACHRGDAGGGGGAGGGGAGGGRGGGGGGGPLPGDSTGATRGGRAHP